MSSAKSECGAVYAAIIKASAAARKVCKGGSNTFDRYKYAKFENYVAACEAALVDAGLAVAYSVVEYRPLPDRPTKKGGVEHAVEILLEATAYASDGSSISVQAAGEGQDRADKSYYKAQTGAKKYALAGLLNLVTTDDPEADQTVGTASGPASARPSIGDVLSEGDVKNQFQDWCGFADKADLKAAWRDAVKASGGKALSGDKTMALVKTWMDKKQETDTAFMDAIGGE